MSDRKVLLILFALVVAAPSFAAGRIGWFAGGGASLFEAAASGKILTSDGDIDFNGTNQSAYGLITNLFVTTDNTIGLGWTNNQLPGLKLNLGYRHSERFVTHLDLFWALSKSEELKGFPSADPNQEYLAIQGTQWSQSSTRLMFDWRPFEPLPLWYLTGGLEYIRFRTRLEFTWQHDQGSQSIRRFEEYDDTGNAFGVVVGTGLQFTGRGTSNTEWFVCINYSYAPFTGHWFAWDTNFLVGGLALEGGFRTYFSKKR